MTDEGERQAAADELQLAHEEVEIATTLLESHHPRVAVARAYFAAFHAARAQLYIEGFEPRTHSGVVSLWSRHFVKTGRYDASTSRLLTMLQKFREEADYSRDFVATESWVRGEVEAARTLVEQIQRDVEAANRRAGDADS